MGGAVQNIPEVNELPKEETDAKDIETTNKEIKKKDEIKK